MTNIIMNIKKSRQEYKIHEMWNICMLGKRFFWLGLKFKKQTCHLFFSFRCVEQVRKHWRELPEPFIQSNGKEHIFMFNVFALPKYLNKMFQHIVQC